MSTNQYHGFIHDGRQKRNPIS